MLGKYRRSSENIPCFIAIKFELGNYKLYLDRQWGANQSLAKKNVALFPFHRIGVI